MILSISEKATNNNKQTTTIGYIYKSSIYNNKILK